MAVQPQTPYKEYTANGSAKSFALEFDCDNQDHLIVLVDGMEPVVGSWSLSSGAVVFNTAPTNGKKITIQRNTPFRRDEDFQSYDNSFRPPGVNNGFDKIWLKLQELGVADWILSNRINDLRAYVDKQDNVLQDNIDSLKNYVDDKDDELRNYLLNAIQEQGVALDQLEEYYSYLMQQLAQVAIDRGWAASFIVSADGSTQQEINDFGGAEWWNKPGGYKLGATVKLENGDIVKSAIPNNINDPNADMTGWDYETKRQDFKKKTIFDYMTGWEIKAFESAAPRTFDFTTIINRTIPLLNTSANGTTQAIYFPAITGGYLIKSCLWVSKCVVLVGDGATMWNTDLDNVNLKSSMIYADFAEKNQWIISSDTKLLSTGVRLAHNAYFTGANSDSKLYSLCDGIQIIGLQIHAKNRVFGGVRLFGAVGSHISPDTVVTNCEYGYLTSASWTSNHLGSSKYGKCGYLGFDQNNSTEVAGYHNPIGSADVSFVNMLNFFQDGYDIPYELMNESTSKFSVVVKKADNVMLDVTCEGADFNVVLDDRVRGSGNLYLEVPAILGLVLGNQCEFNLIGCGGAIKDADVVQLGYNSILVAPTYAFLIENGNHMYRGMHWSPTASAQLPSKYFTEYHQNIVWSDKGDNIVYISPNGSNKLNGANYTSPTNLTQAIKRISNEAERYDNTLKVSGNKAVVFYLIDEGEYTLNEAYLSLFGRISIKKKSTLSINNTILNMTNFVYLTNCHLDITSVTLRIPDVTYDFVSWARNAPFLSYRGINSLVLNDVVTEFQGVNNGILSYANGSDAINTLSIAGGAISGAGLIVQTPESTETNGTTNITIGTSCSVDALIKGKDNGGIGIPKEQQGIVVVPWLLRNASTTYDPSSIPAGLSITTTITLTGVVVGDFVQASFTQYNADVEISAVVSAANTVTVRFKNTSAAAVDLTSGTLSVKKI